MEGKPETTTPAHVTRVRVRVRRRRLHRKDIITCLLVILASVALVWILHDLGNRLIGHENDVSGE